MPESAGSLKQLEVALSAMRTLERRFGAEEAAFVQEREAFRLRGGVPPSESEYRQYTSYWNRFTESILAYNERISGFLQAADGAGKLDEMKERATEIAGMVKAGVDQAKQNNFTAADAALKRYEELQYGTPELAEAFRYAVLMAIKNDSSIKTAYEEFQHSPQYLKGTLINAMGSDLYHCINTAHYDLYINKIFSFVDRPAQLHTDNHTPFVPKTNDDDRDEPAPSEPVTERRADGKTAQQDRSENLGEEQAKSDSEKPQTDRGRTIAKVAGIGTALAGVAFATTNLSHPDNSQPPEQQAEAKAAKKRNLFVAVGITTLGVVLTLAAFLAKGHNMQDAAASRQR